MLIVTSVEIDTGLPNYFTATDNARPLVNCSCQQKTCLQLITWSPYASHIIDKNKNQTTPRCTLFKLIASSLANIFSNTKWFQRRTLHCTHCHWHFFWGVNFLVFMWMACTGAPFIRLTCNLGYFFGTLYSSHLWCWKIFYFLGVGVGSGHIQSQVSNDKTISGSQVSHHYVRSGSNQSLVYHMCVTSKWWYSNK